MVITWVVVGVNSKHPVCPPVPARKLGRCGQNNAADAECFTNEPRPRHIEFGRAVYRRTIT
jgi:hypothetical protein